MLALAVLPGLALFVAMISLSMNSYPGGTWEDRQAPGHSQARNFLCDLTRPVAINGTANTEGAARAELGLLAFAVALAPFFLISPVLFPEKRRLGKLVQVSGALCSVGGVGIVLVPSWRFGPELHGVAVLLAAVPGLIAAISATVGVWTAEKPVKPARAVSAATLGVFVVAVLVFAVQLARGTETTPGLPLLEKSALGLAMIWMLITVQRAWKQS